MEDKVQKIQESDSGIYGAQIASEVHQELKKLGGVKPPKEFVLVDRAAIGLGSVFMHLNAVNIFLSCNYEYTLINPYLMCYFLTCKIFKLKKVFNKFSIFF